MTDTNNTDPLWRRADKQGVGKPRAFKDPATLWDAAKAYFEWVDANPLLEQKGFAFQGVVTKENFNKMRAMTLGGFQLHAGITHTTWANYKKGELGDEYLSVCEAIEKIIKEQKFSGAAADLLNPAIIARDLGLRDGIDHSSEDGSMSPKKEMSLEEMRAECERRGLPTDIFSERS